jgi:hypothetical protein
MKQLKSFTILKTTAFFLINKFIRKVLSVRTKEYVIILEKMVENIMNFFKKYTSSVYQPFEEEFYNLDLKNPSISDSKTINQKLALIGWKSFYVTRIYSCCNLWLNVSKTDVFHISFSKTFKICRKKENNINLPKTKILIKNLYNVYDVPNKNPSTLSILAKF